MDSNGTYIIMVTVDCHPVACIAYVVTSNQLLIGEWHWYVESWNTLCCM